MNPLNDEELNSLLEQTKRRPPEPSPYLAARTLRAYRDEVKKRPRRYDLFLRPLSIPWPLGVLTAVLLLLIGALGEHSFQQKRGNLQPQSLRSQTNTDDIFYQDFGVSQHVSHPAVINLTFKEFQPVHQIRPRVMRSARDDQ